MKFNGGSQEINGCVTKILRVLTRVSNSNHSYDFPVHFLAPGSAPGGHTDL
jgi:hypothetical protein